ncbi:152R [Cherax quadricarinatus iridovirus]|uniref:Holliday junction resolvase n=1 Tax=Shrimp hemocyte iridescent virus TaxID=2039780 RepID=A0A291B0I0_9VIRU|nr:152R [Cherax quadricarinatus iridovirus]YP_010084756.1 hypothetical protein KM509_gp004 [Shrimp hemocyte iridescent virus]UPA43297.1 hypothetical protein 4TH000023 [Iridovirus CN01]ASZ85132.1 152R [Cherax quadricarinatus iridovirus]ATE87013.1 hypothetical protein [Shrimp hemocyte iridescent virus]UPA43532.1 hypothetical protein 3TG000099 [Iridovirus CN01]UPA43729.1 hypothetical protein 1DG000137 [Iridovirus CN01]
MIASFDIGEKNFAYCIGDENEKIYKICYHDVMKKKTQTVVESCQILTEILMDDKMLDECKSIIIEQQMKCNTRAQRVSQHVWSFFHLKFYHQKDVVIKFIPSHFKTQYFLGKNKLDNKQRKVWSIQKVTTEIPIGEELLSQINGLKKKDDVCDTVLQLIAYVNKKKT